MHRVVQCKHGHKWRYICAYLMTSVQNPTWSHCTLQPTRSTPLHSSVATTPEVLFRQLPTIAAHIHKTSHSLLFTYFFGTGPQGRGGGEGGVSLSHDMCENVLCGAGGGVSGSIVCGAMNAVHGHLVPPLSSDFRIHVEQPFVTNYAHVISDYFPSSPATLDQSLRDWATSMRPKHEPRLRSQQLAATS